MCYTFSRSFSPPGFIHLRLKPLLLLLLLLFLSLYSDILSWSRTRARSLCQPEAENSRNAATRNSSTAHALTHVCTHTSRGFVQWWKRYTTDHESICMAYHKTFVFILFVMVCYNTKFWNFINVVMRHDCRDYIGQIQNQSENVRTDYKIFIVNIYLIKRLLYSINNHLKCIIRVKYFRKLEKIIHVQAICIRTLADIYRNLRKIFRVHITYKQT